MLATVINSRRSRREMLQARQLAAGDIPENAEQGFICQIKSLRLRRSSLVSNHDPQSNLP